MGNEPLYNDKRCWGWFADYEQARKCILENWGDIYEQGSYNLAVIESIPEGVPSMVAGETWFRVDSILNEQYGKVVPIDGRPHGVLPPNAPPILSAGWRVRGYRVTEIDRPVRFGNIVHFSY